MRADRLVEGRKAAERAGRAAEDRAAWLLRIKGYRIVARRWRCPKGEIDLVAQRGRLTVFVEVKARARREDARAAVGVRDWQRIARAAEAYQARHLRSITRAVRFDLVTVAGGWPRHHPDAWRGG